MNLASVFLLLFFVVEPLSLLSPLSLFTFAFTMDTKITRDIRVSVETNYQMNYSNPLENKYIFSYSVTIENRGNETVRLLRRHWNIIDATAIHRVVNGDGVVGQQPILEPGNTWQYSSWCHLLSDVGRMWGTYFFGRQPIT